MNARDTIEGARTELGISLDNAREPSSVIHYVDYLGRPCTLGRWAELCEAQVDRDLARLVDVPEPETANWWCLARTEVDGVTVMTKWVGITIFNPNAAFETYVFDDLDDGGTAQYATREQAIAGHEQLVAKIASERADERSSSPHEP